VGVVSLHYYKTVLTILFHRVIEWVDFNPTFESPSVVVVAVGACEAGKRKKWGFHVVHDDLTYVTIEQDNYLVYDSRTEVPSDMEKFSATIEDTKRRMARA
jgi:hypothetical protein